MEEYSGPKSKELKKRNLKDLIIKNANNFKKNLDAVFVRKKHYFDTGTVAEAKLEKTNRRILI